MTAAKPRVDPEVAALIPPLTLDEKTRLEVDLRRNGCLDPLTLWAEGGILLDGHHRLEICSRCGIPWKLRRLSFESRDAALAWTLDYQLGRRNLNLFQRAEMVLKQKPFLARAAKERQREGGHRGGQAAGSIKDKASVPEASQYGQVRDALSGRARVGARTLDAVEKVLQHGTAALKQAARAGNVSIDAAAAVATLPPERQNEVANKGGNAFIQAAKAVRQQKARERTSKRMADVAAQAKVDCPLPDRKYPVLLADPPWKYDRFVPDDRQIENQYPTMTVEQIAALPVPGITTDDAILFLWVPNPLLKAGIYVMEAWGFEYRTDWAWVKDKIGMGVWARQRHELVLIGVRGEMPAPHHHQRPDSVIEAPRGRHSEKPVEVHRRLEEMFDTLPKVELFARQARDGWDVWGNEVAK
jgi:N6-adenosine-specific RNA methylase IME4